MGNLLRLLGSSLLAIQVCGVAAAQEPALFGYPFPLSRTTSSSGADDFAPQVTTDGLGAWVAVWDSFDSLDDSIGADGDILVSRSIDGGYTWSEPTSLDPNAHIDAGDDFFAQVTTDGQGTWIAVWHSFDSLGGTIGRDGDILFSRSTNGGVTWSAAATLNTNASSNRRKDDLFPQLRTDGQGMWVAAWDSTDSLADTIGTDGDILVSRSMDGGVTWSAAVALDPNAGGDSGDDFAPQLTTDGLGVWVAAWHSFDVLEGPIGMDADILVSRSIDGGLSWNAAVPLDPNADSDSGDDVFPQLTTDGLGTWVAVWHSFEDLGGAIGTDADILVSRSTDGGVTWSAAVVLNANASSDGQSSDDLFPQLTTDGQGTWITVWDSTHRLSDTIGPDGDILAARSINGGVTWSAPTPLNPNAGGDVGDDFSPQLTTDALGTWVAVWESSDTLGGTIGIDNNILGAVLDPGIYQDTDSNGSFDSGEERAGGIGGDGGSVFEYAFDLDASTHDLGLTSIELLLPSYDHAFRIDINEVTVVPLDPGNPAVFTPAIDTPEDPNENGLPRLRIALTEASIEFSGTETTSSTAMTPGLVYNQATTNPIFLDGQNSIVIENPDGSGDDGIDFRIRRPTPTPDPDDIDGDGVPDSADNCSAEFNPLQVDTDGDLCGNVCDTDWNQDGISGFPDFGLWILAFGGTDSNFKILEPHTGLIDFADFGEWAMDFGEPPGPSGVTPGTLACP